MTQKFISLNNVAIVTDGRNNHRIHFEGMVESEAMNRKKNADLGDKSRQWSKKKEKLFIVVMPNNTLETMAIQKKHREENKEK